MFRVFDDIRRIPTSGRGKLVARHNGEPFAAFLAADVPGHSFEKVHFPHQLLSPVSSQSDYFSLAMIIQRGLSDLHRVNL
jgi:hypothetical protein